jgi:hypothetical protein
MLQKIPARTAQRQALRAAAREASDAARLDALMALPDQPPRATRRALRYGSRLTPELNEARRRRAARIRASRQQAAR